MFEEDFENEDMAPEEESFAIDEEPLENNGNKSLSELRQKSGTGSNKDAQHLQDTIAKNRNKNSNPNAAKNAAASNAKNNDENNEDEEQPENGESKLENAAKNATSDAAKTAASTAMQAAGVPKPIADKAAEKIVDSEAGQKIIDETIKKFKKKKQEIILQILMAVIPYVLTFFIVVLVVALVYAQLMVIVDKVDQGLTAASSFVEKFMNFTTGGGWNTEEELFFKNLREQYDESLYYNEHGFDIPLLASTIHYAKLTDISIYESDDSGPTDTTTDPDSMGMFDNFLAAEELKNFYYVANDKLGNMYDFSFGNRRLIGHMFDVKLSFEKTNFNTAIDNWQNFIRFFGGVLDAQKSKYNPFQISKNIRTIFAWNAEAAGGNESDNFFEYKFRNYKYEYDEFWEMFEKSKADEHDNQKYSDVNVDNSKITAKEKNSGIWLSPKVEIIYNEDKYYDYLVNVFIPGTYFSDGVYEQETVDRMAREIFEQRDAYNYLLIGTPDEVTVNSCKYNYNSGTSITPTLNSYAVNISLIDNLMVEVLDESCDSISCSDDYIVDTVTFKEYIIGLAHGKLGANVGSNEEWLKSNMIALQSYALGKYSDAIRLDGEKYYIKVTNNDENVYCNATDGCRDRMTNAKNALAENSISFLSDVYDQIKYEFLYLEGSGFVGAHKSEQLKCITSGTVGACMGQDSSLGDAEADLNYKNILGKYYTENIGLLNLATTKLSKANRQCYSPGLVAGNYTNMLIRQSIPTSKDIYFNQPYVSSGNRGQCVWYVKGRASEIIATTVSDKELKDKLLNVLKNENGNGNQWYSKSLQSVFGSSTDYTKPKAGSIGVYTWTEARCLSYWKARGYNYCKSNYGHALIVEEVNEATQTVTITDGYTNTGSCPTDWNCINFRSRTNYPISNLDDLGGEYIFIGYIYLLD